MSSDSLSEDDPDDKLKCFLHGLKRQDLESQESFRLYSPLSEVQSEEKPPEPDMSNLTQEQQKKREEFERAFTKMMSIKQMIQADIKKEENNSEIEA